MNKDAARRNFYSYGFIAMTQISFEALIVSQLIKKVMPSTEPETPLPFSQETLKLLFCK
jgi:hypothetical protein